MKKTKTNKSSNAHKPFKTRGFKSETSSTLEDKSFRDHNNDWSWYTPNEQILNDVARVPYSYPVGVPYHRSGTLEGHNIFTTSQYDEAVPGILSMDVFPTLGNAKQPNDTINVAANGIYTFVRHLNSGSRNYDANDLMIYILSVDSLYMIIHWAMRLYGTLMMYSQANRYLPRYLCELQDVDFDDFMLHIAEFRAGINARIPRIASLCVPAVLPIFQRHMWLFDHYYIEGDSEKDQIYFYNMAGYYRFGYDNDGAGKLDAFLRPYEGTKTTVASLLASIDSMLDPIFADEDFNIVSGDIFRAYQGNIMKLSPLPDEYRLGLEYAPDVLLQFKNAKCKQLLTNTADKYKDDFFQVHQSSNKGYLITETPETALQYFYLVRNGAVNGTAVISSSIAEIKQTFAGVMNEYSKDILITSPHNVVDPKETMVNTRISLTLDISYDPNEIADVKFDALHFASEWPLRFRTLATHKDVGTGVVSAYVTPWNTAMAVTNADISIDQFFNQMIPILSTFKYAPEVRIVTIEYSDFSDPNSWSVHEAARSLFELDNYTWLSHSVMARLHDTAMMGEYDIPRVAYTS